MNYDDFFEQNAFKNIDKSILFSLKDFSKKVQNKNANEIAFEAMNFYKTLQNKKNFSENERALVVEVILMSMPEKDRAKFFAMFDMIKNMNK